MGFWAQLIEFMRRWFTPDGKRLRESVALPYEGDVGPSEAQILGDASFTAAVIGLGAKMAKADGQVTEEEVAAFSRVFRAAPEDQKSVARVFNIARQSVTGFEAYAHQIANRFKGEMEVLEAVLDGLFQIAVADRVVTSAELDYLKTVADIFGFDTFRFERLKATHMGPSENDPFAILGVKPDDDFETIKKAYRELVSAHHPDRVKVLGAPREFEIVAHEKTAAITAAFAKIKAGLRPMRTD